MALNSLPKEQQGLGQLMMLMNGKLDQFVSQVQQKQGQQEEQMLKLEGEFKRQHEANVQRHLAGEQMHREVKQSLEELRQNLEEHRKDLENFKKEVGDKTGNLDNNIKDTKRDLSDRVGQAEARAQQASATSSGTPSAAEKLGIVFGGFSGQRLAEKGGEWLREVMRRRSITFLEVTARTRRPKVFVIRFDNRDQLWKAWRQLKKIIAEMKQDSSDFENEDITEAWISLDQPLEERQRTKPIAQAARCCRSASEVVGLSKQKGFDVEVRYRQEEETVKVTMDEWRTEVLMFFRSEKDYVMNMSVRDLVGHQYFDTVAKEWELSRSS